MSNKLKVALKQAATYFVAAVVAFTSLRTGIRADSCDIERGLDPLDIVKAIAVRHNVWIILDISGSMQQTFTADPKAGRKIDVAVNLLNGTDADPGYIRKAVDASGRPTANWAYATFDRDETCVGMEVRQTVAKCDENNNKELLGKIIVESQGRTPIGYSLFEKRDADGNLVRDGLAKEIAKATGGPNGKIDKKADAIQDDTLLTGQKNFIVFLTDGEDTCEPETTSDPNPEIRTNPKNYDDTPEKADTPREIQAYLAGKDAAAALALIDPDNDGSKGEIIVIGMDTNPSFEGLVTHIGFQATGNKIPRRPPEFAQTAQALKDAIEAALGKIGVPAVDVSLSASVVGTVKELIPGEVISPTGINGTNSEVTIAAVQGPNNSPRTGNRNNVLFETSVEVPSFKGHLVARRIFRFDKTAKPPKNAPDFEVFWDAGPTLRDTDPVDRVIYFNRRGQTKLRPLVVCDDPNAPDDADCVRPKDLGVKKGFLTNVDQQGALSDLDAAKMVVGVVRGYELKIDKDSKKLYKTDGKTLNFTGGKGTWKLYDATHPGPALAVNPPRNPGFDDVKHNIPEYGQYYKDQYNRLSVVYMGTNAGLMHAFRADTGVELFAYVPDDVLGLWSDELDGSRPTLAKFVRKLVSGEIGDVQDHTFLMSGPVSVQDAFLRKDWTGGDDKWHTIIGFGRGEGGKFMTVMDVSTIGDWKADGDVDPRKPSGTTPAPRLLWNRGNRSAVSNDSGIDEAKLDGMGETWSAPAIGEVPLDDPQKPQAVLFAGSGYGCDGTDEGKFFYVFRLEDGFVLKRSGGDPNNDDNPLASESGAAIQKNVFVAAPVALNPHTYDQLRRDSRDFVTRVYIGDLQGNIYKLNSASTDIKQWKFQKFFDLPNNQPISAPVALLRDRSNPSSVFVFVGSGGDTRIPDSNRSMLVGILDSSADPANDPGTQSFVSVNLDTKQRVFVAPVTASSGGAVLGAGSVFFASTRRDFAPTLCQDQFSSRLYGFFASTGLGAFDADSKGEKGKSTIELGSGKVQGLYHRSEHLYVSLSGGFGLKSGTLVVGGDDFSSKDVGSGKLTVLIDGFRISPF